MTHRPRWDALGAGALLLVMVTGAGAGCGGDFDPYDRLTSLRVLAMKSDPVAPAPGEMTMLSALVYTPPPADPATPPPTVRYEWSWCPFVGSANAGYPCLVTEAQLQALAGVPISFSLGTEPVVKFTHAIDPALLKQICDGQPGLPPPPNCQDGFPVTITLKVSTDTDKVTAVRSLNLLLAPATQPNTNPSINPILFATLATGDVPLDPTVLLKRHADNNVKADVSMDAAEVYDGLDDDGKPATLTERLYLSWFVETGTMVHPRTGYNAAAVDVPFDTLLKGKWRPDNTRIYPRDTAQLIVVLRDSRDGVIWTSATVGLEPTP